MNKLSTKNIKTDGEGVSKTLEPGVSLCKINNITLEEFEQDLKKANFNDLSKMKSKLF